MKNNSGVVILFATTVAEERIRFLELAKIRSLGYEILFPQDLREADALVGSRDVDLIVTDLSFADGAFVDWLVLWPRPFILLAYFGEEARVDQLIGDEACSFVMRDSSYRHLGSLPTMIRKVLNVRESLNRQNAHLQITERRYLDLVSSLPDIVYTLDGQGRFIYVNDSVSMLGFKPAELIGRHFSEIIESEDVAKVSRELVLRDLAGKVTGPEGAPKLFDERRRGERMTRNLEVRLRNKPPTPGSPPVGKVLAYGEVSCVGYSLPEYEGSDNGTVGVIRDVTNRKLAELKLKESLRVKEVLLKEIHHRVKNNMQVVSSLLHLQESSIEDPPSREIFQACQTQIHAMAMVHEQLYRSDNLQAIDMKAFLDSLLDFLYRVFDVDDSKVVHDVSCDSVVLGIDQAIPVALIVNELVSNSLKHGLSSGEGRISVSLAFDGAGALRLEVQDSGAGLPEDFRIEETDTLGFQLIQALGAQLGGDFSWQNVQGARCMLRFPYVDPSAEALF